MKKRIFSALVMILICVPILFIGGIPFKILIGIIGLLAYKEIIDLKGIKEYPLGVIVAGLIAMLALTYSNNDMTFGIIGLDYKYIMFTFLIMFLPVVFYFNTKKYTFKDAFILTSFISFIGIILNLAMNIFIYDTKYFIMLLLISILSDTFGLFIGLAIGKHKVTKISPKKSLEGYIGGTLMATILVAIYYMTFIGSAPLVKVIPVLIFLCLISEIGDLFYSAIKREVGKKDFSNLIPEHGGILDRIDSFTFVVMAFVLIYGII